MNVAPSPNRTHAFHAPGRTRTLHSPGRTCALHSPYRAQALHPENRTRALTSPPDSRNSPRALHSQNGTRALHSVGRAHDLPNRVRITVFTTLIAAFTLLPLSALPARASPQADTSTWRWPLHGQVRILRRFAPPPQPWLAGHRGVDLAAPVATPVLAAGPGTIRFAGPVAGKGVVTIDHPNGLRTTYLPVKPSVSRGHQVTPGTEIGVIDGSTPHCPESCLHWGLIRDAHYLDPLHLLGHAPTRLLPFWPQPGDRSATPYRGPNTTSRTTTTPFTAPDQAPRDNAPPPGTALRQPATPSDPALRQPADPSYPALSPTTPSGASPRRTNQPSVADVRRAKQLSVADLHLHQTTDSYDSHPSFTALAHHSPIAGALPTPSTSTTKQTFTITPPAIAPTEPATAGTRSPSTAAGEGWAVAAIIRQTDSTGDTPPVPSGDVRTVPSPGRRPATEGTHRDVTETARETPADSTSETVTNAIETSTISAPDRPAPRKLTTTASETFLSHPPRTADTSSPTPTLTRAMSYPLRTALTVTAFVAALLLIALRCHRHRGHRGKPRYRTTTKGQHRKSRHHRTNSKPRAHPHP